MPFIGNALFRGGNQNGNGLNALIYAYKAVLKAENRSDRVNLDFCPNPNLKFKKLILVHNCQET
jgi:hypothetical protein